MANLTISVISPEKVLYSGEGSSINIPGKDGYFGVLPDHASLVAELDVGILKITSGNSVVQIVIEGGFAQVKANSISILTNGGDRKEAIKLAEVEKQLEQVSSKEYSPSKELEIKKLKARIQLAKS
ncbi:MAG: ATP synthase F1 subunit epsilon [Leptospiraceae bacterium]|nr:ATP synthase F1 subunit epsilon [Leptospiraceae bacterium]